MSHLVYVVDLSQRALPIVEEALARADTMIQSIPDLASARRKLVQAIPSLVICPLDAPDEPQGGLRFCRELHAHPTYADVPVILYADDLSEDSIHQAMQAGAKGILQFPFSVAILQHRVKSIVPSLVPAAEPPKSAPQSSPQSETPATKVPVVKKKAAAAGTPAPQATPAGDDFEEKMRLAQTLLAKVLHNLKTSDLLRLSEKEDVPRVVYEMTRSVCGVAGDEPGKKQEESVLSGLESAFRRER